MRDRKMPSIISVAEEAGVSLQTVSNVLNFPERVKPETTERVMQAINKLNYTPNLSARRLRSKKSASIAYQGTNNKKTGLIVDVDLFPEKKVERSKKYFDVSLLNSKYEFSTNV